MSKHLWWVVPVLAFVLYAPFSSSLDLLVARWFYGDHRHFQSNWFYDLMYHEAVIPAQVIGYLALPIFLLSFKFPALKKWRSASLLLVLTIAIGAGLIVHVLLKNRWGRPRPVHVTEFGGVESFRPFYQPNFFHGPPPLRSFPCGHCTMGFYFFAVAFVCKRGGYRRLALICFAFAILFGLAIGVARIAQGGHFLSDVLVSGLIMWLCAAFFDKLLFEWNLLMLGKQDVKDCAELS